MKRSKNAVIGLVVVGAIAILIWGINFLKGNNFFTTEQTYYAKYQRVDGLKKSSLVTLKGLKIGKIKSIDFIDNGANLLVEFSVNSDLKFPKNTIARIISADIMGTKEIQLIIGKSDKPLLVGDTLNGQTEGDLKEQVSMQMLPLKRKAEKLMSSVDSVLAVIQYVFNKDTRDNLRRSFGSIEQTFAKLESTSSSLNTIISGQKYHLSSMITNLDSITYNLKNNNKNITSILSNFANISDSLSATTINNTLQHIQSTMQNANNIIARINSGKGSLGSLLNNDTLYLNLENASNSLNNLLLDFQNNPKKYVHFSIFDTGKKVYLNNTDKKRFQQTIYAIQILSASKKINFNSPTFKGYKKIKEVYHNGIYKYIIFESKKEKEIIKKLSKVKTDFPKAFIIKITEEKIL